MSISYRSREVPAVLIEPTYRRIRLKRGEEVIADSTQAIVIYENGGHPVYYLPKTDFHDGVLQPSEKSGASPVLGARRYWSLDGAGDSAWSYEHVPEGVPDLAGYATVAWSAVRWFEEDEEIFGHPRNVHWRVDAIDSKRRVEVVVDGTLVARTNRAVFLFETSLIPRYYFPVEDLIAGTLADSALHTYCPYKGRASYYHFDLNGNRHENIVWYYPEPLHESGRIKGLISFYNEKVDEIRVSAGDAE